MRPREGIAAWSWEENVLAWEETAARLCEEHATWLKLAGEEG